MANSSRLNKNRNGQMLIPMNVDGGAWDNNFINSTKFCILIVMGFINVGVVVWLYNAYTGWVFNLLVGMFMVFINQLVLRYLILEEKYYYRMYKKMKQYEISNPSVFWNIASMRDTDDGAVLIYADGKVGIMVRLERDTITGKPTEFKEVHYDAISDFYKEINLKGLKFVQMNIMEQAGKDPRLQKLDELVIKADNPNISKIIEYQVGYIKKITRATLFESDYFLFYYDDINKSDAIVGDVIDCIYKILDGAFIGFSVLNSSEVLEMVKEQYGVKYFDYTEATVSMYKNYGTQIPKAFKLTGIIYENGEEVEVGVQENNRLNSLSSYIKSGLIEDGEWTVKEALSGKIKSKGTKGGLDENKLTKYSDIIGDMRIKDTGLIDLDNDIFGVSDDNSSGNKIGNIASNIVDDILYPKVEDGEIYIELDEENIKDNSLLDNLDTENNNENNNGNATSIKNRSIFGNKKKKER